jgi:hypothetical protein
MVSKEDCFGDDGLQAAALGFEEIGDGLIDKSGLLFGACRFSGLTAEKQLPGLWTLHSAQG